MMSVGKISENNYDFSEANLKRIRVASINSNRNSKTSHTTKVKYKTCVRKILQNLPTVVELKQYLAVFICVILLWGISWFLLGESVLPKGSLFNMAGVVIAGYIFGHTLERYTSINAVVGMTLIGALYRNFGPENFLLNTTADLTDFHLRRIYPAIILTKGPLSWNWEYIKHNSVKVFSLATLPWIVECLSTAFFAHILLRYPWYWGLHLGSILASVSPAIVLPIVSKLQSRGFGTTSQMLLLVGNAGGLDTCLSVGLNGVINSAIFFQASPVYRVVKGLLAIFVGIALGILGGVLSDELPDHKDIYAPTIRSLFILALGVLWTYACGYVGWGGVSGVAIMVCAGTAATRWARRDWPLTNNPVWEVYKLLWRIFEPMLFTLSGYFLNISQISFQDIWLILGCIFAPLLLRMLAAFFVALTNGLTARESIFVAVTWIPKAIVEACVVRIAIDTLWEDATLKDKNIAAQHSNIIVMAIIITSTLASILPAMLGPILLSQEPKDPREDLDDNQILSPPQLSNQYRRHTPNLSNFP